MAKKYLSKSTRATLLICIMVFICVALLMRCEDGQAFDMASSTLDLDRSMSDISYVDWSKIKPRKKVHDMEDLHDKWIVATSVSLPTEQVKNLSKIKGWRLIVVADLKTPKDWR